MRVDMGLWGRASRRINPSQMFGWCLGVGTPIAIAVGLFICWRNRVASLVTVGELMFRGCIALIGFAVALVVIWNRVFAPAVRAERKEMTGERAGGENDAR